MEQLSKVIAIFAHNEEKKIVECLESVRCSNELLNTVCYVLVNGCTDNTATVVSHYAKEYPFVELVNINYGDKANAWNYFIHTVAPVADIYYFLDGDCRIFPDSLLKLEQCYLIDKSVNVISAIPDDVGHSTKQQAKEMLEHGGVAGNLYALSNQFVVRLRDNNVNMPIGLIGEDSLLGAYACWDLKAGQKWDKYKIRVCPEALFTYNPLSIFNINDLILYYKRRKRYSLRHFQIKMIQNQLQKIGPSSLPKKINSIYASHAKELTIRRNGLNLFFDWLILKQLSKHSS